VWQGRRGDSPPYADCLYRENRRLAASSIDTEEKNGPLIEKTIIPEMPVESQRKRYAVGSESPKVSAL
jgi:hypothetical protein